MLEVYYNQFDNFCGSKKPKKVEMIIDSLHYGFAEKELTDLFRSKEETEQEKSRSMGTDNIFVAVSQGFLRRTCFPNDKKNNISESFVFRCTEMLCLCSKRTAAILSPQNLSCIGDLVY